MFIWAIALATFLFAISLILIVNIINNPTELEGIQVELTDAGGGVIADGQNVLFNTVLNDQSNNISYNPGTGEFIITRPGNYVVSWWTAPDGAEAATSVSFAVAVNGVPYSTASSPIVSVQMSATALVTVTTVPATISLVNVTGAGVFVPTIPVQAGMVITALTT